MMASHKSLLALSAVLYGCSGGEPQFTLAVRMHAYNGRCPPTPARERGFRGAGGGSTPAHLFASLFADGDEQAVNALPTEAFASINAAATPPASPVAGVVAGSAVANQWTVGVAAPASPTTFAGAASPVTASAPRGPLSFASDSPDGETENADDLSASGSAAVMSSPSAAQRAGSPECGGAVTPPFQGTPPRSVPSVAFGGGNKLFHEQEACVAKLQGLERDAERRLQLLGRVIPDAEFAMPVGAPEFSVRGNVVSFGTQVRFDKNYLVDAETSVLHRSVANAREIMVKSIVDGAGAGGGAPRFIFTDGCGEVEGDEDSISLGDGDLTLADAPTLHTHPGLGEDRHQYVELPPSSPDMKMMLKVIKREMTERAIGMDAELVAENTDVPANKWHFVLADVHLRMPEEKKVLYAFTVDPRVVERAVSREVVEGRVDIPRGFLRALDSEKFPSDLASAEGPREAVEEESFLAGGGGGSAFAATEAAAATEGRTWLPGLAFTSTPGVFRVESTDLPGLTDATPHSDHAGVCQAVSDRLITPKAHARATEELRIAMLPVSPREGGGEGKRPAKRVEVEDLCLRPRFPTAGFRGDEPDGKYPQRLVDGDRVELLNIDEVEAALARSRSEANGENRRSRRSRLRGTDDGGSESPEKKARTVADEGGEGANEPLVLKVRTERVKLSKRISLEEGLIDAESYIDHFYQEAYTLLVKNQISFENFQRLCASVGVYVQRIEL